MTDARSNHDRHTEPDGLVVGRRDRKIQERARFVPHAAVVGCYDAEAVVAGRKIGIERLPAIAGVLPIAIVAFELVAKPHLFRRDEAERCIVDLQIARSAGASATARLASEVAS